MREPRYRVSGLLDRLTATAHMATLRGNPDERYNIPDGLTGEEAERLASLLTADDERIAREGHRARVNAEPPIPACSIAAWREWAVAARQPDYSQIQVAELDRLEAAYRATQEQPPHA